MTDRPTIVWQMRGWMINELRSVGAEATQEVLDALDTVPHNGDDEAYLVEACHVIRLTAPRVIQKRIDGLHAEIASNNAKADALEAFIAAQVEAFRRSPTSPTVQ